MTKTLEVPEREFMHNAIQKTQAVNDQWDSPDETLDESLAPAEPGNQESETPDPPDSAQPELTDEQKIEAYIRKEQVLRDAQTELVNLEHTVANLRREINGYKEPIADARSKVARLISCDVHGFLKWEQEQELPLLRKAEAVANAWRYDPVEKLDVTEKDKENLAEHFTNCGSVADWLCKDFPDKKKGLNGEATKERLRAAIAKISGTGATE